MVLGIILNSYFYLDYTALIKNIFLILWIFCSWKKLNSLFINGDQNLLEGGLWQGNYFTQTTESVGGDHTKPASPFEPSVASSRESHWLKIV